MCNSSKKQFTICCVIFYIVFGGLFIFGTFRDLQVDMALFDFSNSFGYFMEKWGTLPIHFVEALGFAVLLGAYHPFEEAMDIGESFLPFIGGIRRNKVGSKLLFVLHKIIYLVFVWGVVGGCDDMARNISYIFTRIILGEKMRIEEGLVFAGCPETAAEVIKWIIVVALAALLVFLASRINKKYMKSLELLALVGIVMYFGSDIIGVLKDFVARVRFREMIAFSHGMLNEEGLAAINGSPMPREWIKDTDFSAFTPWYIRGSGAGIYSDPSSFPSGHTTDASFVMLLFPLMASNEKWKKLLVPSFIVSFGYVLAMALSRMIRGAHYLTDVSSAALIMFTVCLVVYILFSALQAHSEKNIKK